MLYVSWDMECNAQNFLSFCTIFCPCTPEKSKFWENGDIVILHMYNINDNHVMYCSWDIECNRQIFLSFWTIFSPFTPLKTWKIKILKKWKNHLEILSFYTCTINDNHVMSGSWDMKYGGQNFLSFWTVFCPFTLTTTQKIKILKNWKECLETLSFYACVP